MIGTNLQSNKPSGLTKWFPPSTRTNVTGLTRIPAALSFSSWEHSSYIADTMAAIEWSPHTRRTSTASHFPQNRPTQGQEGATRLDEGCRTPQPICRSSWVCSPCRHARHPHRVVHRLDVLRGQLVPRRDRVRGRQRGRHVRIWDTEVPVLEVPVTTLRARECVNLGLGHRGLQTARARNQGNL